MPLFDANTSRVASKREKLTIKQFLHNTSSQNNTCIITAQIVMLQDELPPDDLVEKKRRRLMIADHTGIVLVFLMRTKSWNISVGDTIIITDFRYSNGAITVHDKSYIGK